MKRPRVAAGAAAVIGAAAAVAALVIGTATAQAADTTSSAYGAKADGQFPFSATPYVESTDGSDQENSAAALPDNDFITAEAITLTAGNDKASAELANIEIGGSDEALDEIDALLGEVEDVVGGLCEQSPLPTELPTDLIPGLEDVLGDVTGIVPADLCDVLSLEFSSVLGLDSVEVSCEGDSGTMSLGTVTLLGQAISVPGSPAPNTTLFPDNPLLNITANKQTKHDDGSFSISGLHVDIADGTQTIDLAGATCGKPQETDTPSGGDEDRNCKPSGGDVEENTPLEEIYDNEADLKDDPFDLDRDNDGVACDHNGEQGGGEAPAPSPVTTNLPVTG